MSQSQQKDRARRGGVRAANSSGYVVTRRLWLPAYRGNFCLQKYIAFVRMNAKSGDDHPLLAQLWKTRGHDPNSFADSRR